MRGDHIKEDFKKQYCKEFITYIRHITVLKLT